MKKMRQKENGITLNIIEHIILKNFWEYYLTDDFHNEDIVRALVMGYETEIGDISLSEIKPYIASKTKKLNEIMPASGWEWVES